jgi:membrane-anchored protein YejM (alkaline phosphatase superfamily)
VPRPLLPCLQPYHSHTSAHCRSYPNSSDPRGVTALSASLKVPGDDSTFLIDRFETFLAKQIAAANPWLAHICFHAIHEPHPAMPVFWNMYATPGTNRGDPNYRDPDYLGALTMWDVQVGRLLKLLKDRGVADSTAIFYTCAVFVASSSRAL